MNTITPENVVGIILYSIPSAGLIVASLGAVKIPKSTYEGIISGYNTLTILHLVFQLYVSLLQLFLLAVLI